MKTGIDCVIFIPTGGRSLLFRPNKTCLLYKKVGMSGIGAKLRYAEKPITERCAVLRALQSTAKSSVRADSSASRGAAWEIVCDYFLLFTPSTQCDLDDMLTVDGMRLKVKSKRAQYSVTGMLDHYEVGCTICVE